MRSCHLCLMILLCVASLMDLPELPASELRIATFNVSLNRRNAGDLTSDLRQQDPQAIKVARILRIVRPDVVLLNEFDYDADGESLELFQRLYLQAEELPGNTEPLLLPHKWASTVNTGIPSLHDLDGNGQVSGPEDCFGFGWFPGQYGMAVLSRFPMATEDVRTFQTLLWSEMPNARRPKIPQTTRPWHSDAAWKAMRLSSKSHWDIPVDIDGKRLHLLASHPTPPAFDGPEDRNGCRNADEIRFWVDYLSPQTATWIVDDKGGQGGLASASHFCIVGDLNADPSDGASQSESIQSLLDHSLVNSDFTPASEGAVEATSNQGQKNKSHQGPADHDTADFSDIAVGNLRVDYVLPSRTLTVTDSGVFWPASAKPSASLIDCSDHHLVWIDLELPQ
jgi:hypothetical protein